MVRLARFRSLANSSFQSAGAVASAPQEHAPAPLALPAVSGSEQARIKTMLAKLSPQDQKLAQARLLCALDQESLLGSMGPILKVMCNNRPMFVCCQAEALVHPNEILAKVEQMMARIRAVPKR